VNDLLNILVNDMVRKEVSGIREVTFNHFEIDFRFVNMTRPNIANLHFKYISKKNAYS
jgi:hypothetical protein